MDSSSGRDIIRVGIFGATFDPPHIAHFVAAEAVAAELQLDKVIFIPANLNPLKQGHKPAPPEVRLRMVCESIKENPLFAASTLELDRGGVSYMVDTISLLRSNFKPESYRIFLLLGADAAAEFHLWKNYKELAELATVVVFNRPGYDLSKVSGKIDIEHLTVSVPPLEISSTSIRERIKAGKSIDYLVTPGCKKIIEDLQLYI